MPGKKELRVKRDSGGEYFKKGEKNTDAPSWPAVSGAHSTLLAAFQQHHSAGVNTHLLGPCPQSCPWASVPGSGMPSERDKTRHSHRGATRSAEGEAENKTGT